MELGGVEKFKHRGQPENRVAMGGTSGTAAEWSWGGEKTHKDPLGMSDVIIKAQPQFG